MRDYYINGKNYSKKNFVKLARDVSALFQWRPETKEKVIEVRPIGLYLKTFGPCKKTIKFFSLEEILAKLEQIFNGA